MGLQDWKGCSSIHIGDRWLTENARGLMVLRDNVCPKNFKNVSDTCQDTVGKLLVAKRNVRKLLKFCHINSLFIS